MSDLERLAKIEARHNSVTSEDRIGPKRHAQYVLLHEDMPWLLARVREREAQVKRGAAVIDAAREWAKARNAVQTETGNIGTDWRKNGYDWKAAIARKARAEARAKKAEHNLRVAIDMLSVPEDAEME